MKQDKVVTQGKKAAHAAGDAARRFLVGEDLGVLRRKLPRRSEKADKANRMARPVMAKMAAWIAFTVLAMWDFTAIHSSQPENPAWWALVWLLAGLTFAVGGYLFGWAPTSHRANGLFVFMLAFGFFAVAFATQFFNDMNFLVGLIAAVFAGPFAALASHYGKALALHHAGYKV